MLTKKRLLTILQSYKRSDFELFRRWFGGRGASANFNSLSQYINSITTENLSADNIKEIKRLMDAEKDTTSETYRIFALIKKEIEEDQKTQLRLRALETAPQISKALKIAAFKAWTESYPYRRSKNVVAAVNEIAPYFSQSTLFYSENTLTLLILAFTYYGIKFTDYSSIVAGRLPQLVSHTFIANTSRIRRMHPAVHWFIGLGLQVGFDFMVGVGGRWVISYAVSTLFESLANSLFDFVKSKRPATQQPLYPHSEELLKNILGDIAFCGGSILGQSIFNRLNQPSIPNDERAERKENIIELTEGQRNLLFNEQHCKANITGCHETALSVLQLNPKKLYSQKEIKNAYRSLSLIWHPDKNKDNRKSAEENMAIITAANDALKIRS